jgi:hypothetical protein
MCAARRRRSAGWERRLAPRTLLRLMPGGPTATAWAIAVAEVTVSSAAKVQRGSGSEAEVEARTMRRRTLPPLQRRSSQRCSGPGCCYRPVPEMGVTGGRGEPHHGPHPAPGVTTWTGCVALPPHDTVDGGGVGRTSTCGASRRLPATKGALL